MQQTVLTVEDTTGFRQLIRMALEFGGYEVLEAPDGTQGLAMARAQRPDLIMLDLKMPGIDGLSLCRMLKQDAQLHGTPVVMLSGAAEEGPAAESVAAGAAAYLVKPFSPKDLLSLVGRLLGEGKTAPDATGPVLR